MLMPHSSVPQSRQVGATGGTGPNNVGLLVRTTGRVLVTGTDANSGLSYADIDDGSAFLPGWLTRGVRVYTDALLSPGNYVLVTGLAGLELRDGLNLPVVRTRTSADVQVVSGH